MAAVKLQVNLFDNTFRHDLCSTGWAEPAHLEYVRDRFRHPGVTLFTDGYLARQEVDLVESPVKIGWLHEPRCLYPQVYADAVVHAHKFDCVLTYHAELLGRPGFRFMPYAGVWIPRPRWGLLLKSQLCSMLYGAKKATEGHRLRHALAPAVAVPYVDFYGARGVPVDYSPETKLRVLGRYAFTIVTETCRQDNLFTEILLDCFAVGTIPIFWGCPNVGDFFDARGVLSFETVEECVAIVRDLSFDRYRSLLPYAQENLRRAADYAVAEDWMYEHVLKAYLGVAG